MCQVIVLVTIGSQSIHSLIQYNTGTSIRWTVPNLTFEMAVEWFGAWTPYPTSTHFAAVLRPFGGGRTLSGTQPSFLIW